MLSIKSHPALDKCMNGNHWFVFYLFIQVNKKADVCPCHSNMMLGLMECKLQHQGRPVWFRGPSLLIQSLTFILMQMWNPLNACQCLYMSVYIIKTQLHASLFTPAASTSAEGNPGLPRMGTGTVGQCGSQQKQLSIWPPAIRLGVWVGRRKKPPPPHPPTRKVGESCV